MTAAPARKVLVIDDDQDTLTRLKAVFERGGYNVVTAADGDAGLKLARAIRPDLIITDLLLPRTSGFVLTRELREDKALCDVPVIWMTAFYSHDDIRDRLSMPDMQTIGPQPACILHKPFSLESLLARVDELLGGKALDPAPLRVLVVDDDAANLEMIERRLEAEGMRPVLVETGAAALSRLAAEEFDAVLLDLRLPDLDGFQVLAEIRAKNLGLPVLMMTAHGSEALAVQALTQGAAHYLIKPISRRELVFAIRNATEAARLQAENRRAHANLLEAVQALQVSVGHIERDHNRLLTLLESLREGVLVVNAHGRVELANKAAMTVLRTDVGAASLAEILSGLDAVVPETGEAWLDDLAGRLVREALHDAYLEFRWSDGEVRALIVSSTPFLDEVGADAGRILVVRDDTRRWQARQQLEALLERQSKALQVAGAVRRKEVESAASQADRVRSAILANVSHELRTPINFIMGFGSLLVDGVLGDLTPEQRETIQKMLMGADRLRDVVEDMLDAAMLASGKLSIRTEAFDLPRVVAEAVEAQLVAAREKGVRLLLDFAGEPGVAPAQPRGDEDAARRMVRHLVSNGIKFTPTGGEVRVRVETRKDGNVAVAVEDTGIGIPPELWDHLFTPFYQVEADSTRRFSGTGMGLTLVKGLADAMGAEVEVDSTPGQGSTFRVLWPAAT